METVSQTVLQDLTNYMKLKESLSSFIKELQASDTNAFKDWSSQTRRDIENTNLRYINIHHIKKNLAFNSQILIKVYLQFAHRRSGCALRTRQIDESQL